LWEKGFPTSCEESLDEKKALEEGKEFLMQTQFRRAICWQDRRKALK
jgi:hypothetical protein